MTERLGDRELWRAVEHTLRHVVLPAISDDHDWARAAAVQLAGLARYAATRPDDRSAARLDELQQVLVQLAGNPLLEELQPEPGAGELLDVAGRALAAAVGRVDADAEQIRTTLRQLLVRQLDDELASTGPLVAAFRGRLDE